MAEGKGEGKSSKYNPLENFLEKFVQIITNDGKIFVGTLRGLDQTLNAVISDCEERIYSTSKGIQINKVGLYIIRGDNIAIIGEIDEDIEAHLDFSAIKAAPLKKIHLAQTRMDITTEEDAFTHEKVRSLTDQKKKNMQGLSSLAKNRRYRKLEQLIEAGDYFSEETVRMRRPIIYHLYVGRYKRAGDFSELTMTDFLMDYIQKNEYQTHLLQELSKITDKAVLKKMLKEKEIDSETLSENEDELIQLMHLMFLAGDDKDFVNYEEIDADRTLDDQKLDNQDMEDKYFDGESEEMDEENEKPVPNGGSEYTGIQDF